MRIAATGFLSEKSGSVASANALLLRALVERGHTVDFFSKASFVDPRPAVGKHSCFRFFDVDNVVFDRFRRFASNVPGISQLANRIDAFTYNRMLIKRISEAHRLLPYDVCLWMGDYARGRIPTLKAVSFAQGAPGSDARSIRDRSSVIKDVAGHLVYWRWRILAALRLSRWGLPPFHHSDRIIIGSSVSRNILFHHYLQKQDAVSPLPYPIDLKLFAPPDAPRPKRLGLRVLWLGRIVPRKRLELFLNAGALAIRKGVDLRLTVVGSVGFIPGYEMLMDRFEYRDRLEQIPRVQRTEVPALMHQHDALCQPSDEENFGSSVAEAQACGLPVIVGSTNGNSDYLCERDIHLIDDNPETLAAAFAEMASRGDLNNPMAVSISRKFAEATFSLEAVVSRLEGILLSTQK